MDIYETALSILTENTAAHYSAQSEHHMMTAIGHMKERKKHEPGSKMYKHLSNLNDLHQKLSNEYANAAANHKD